MVGTLLFIMLRTDWVGQKRAKTREGERKSKGKGEGKGEREARSIEQCDQGEC